MLVLSIPAAQRAFVASRECEAFQCSARRAGRSCLVRGLTMSWSGVQSRGELPLFFAMRYDLIVSQIDDRVEIALHTGVVGSHGHTCGSWRF